MSNFIIDCIQGDALMSDVDDYISKWHNSDSNSTLYDFLGMTKKEYALFVEDEEYLGNIIAAKKYGKNIITFIEHEIMSLVARSDNSEKARRLQKWLESEGLWD